MYDFVVIYIQKLIPNPQNNLFSVSYSGLLYSSYVCMFMNYWVEAFRITASNVYFSGIYSMVLV